MSNQSSPLAAGALRGFLWIFGSSLVGAVLRLALFAVLARLVLPADFGVITAALILIGLADLLIGIGAGPAIIQRPSLSDDEIATAFWTTLLIAGMVSGLAVLVRQPLAALLGVIETADVIPVLTLVFLFKGLQALPASLLRRDMRFREIALVDTACFLLSYGIVGISLALTGHGYWALVIATVVHSLLQCGLFWSFARPGLAGKISVQALQTLYTFGAGVTFTRVVHEVLTSADKWVVGRFMGAESLGFYGRASALANFPHGFVANAIDKVIFSAFSRRQADLPALRTACLRAYSLTAFALVPLSAFVAVVAPEMVRILLGEGWEQAVLPLQVLAFASCFRSNIKLTSALAQAVDRVLSLSAVVAVQGLLTVGLCLGGSRWGMVGVASGYLIAGVSQLLISMWLNSRIVGAIGRSEWKYILRDAAIQLSLVLVLAGGFAVWLRHLQAPALVVIFFPAMICIAIYLLPLLVPRLPWGQDLRWAAAMLFRGDPREAHL